MPRFPIGSALSIYPNPTSPNTFITDLASRIDDQATPIGLPDVSGFEGVWRYAAEIVTHEDVLHAIELVAKELRGGSPDG